MTTNGTLRGIIAGTSEGPIRPADRTVIAFPAPSCQHRPVTVGDLEIIACPSCRTTDWFRAGEAIDPAQGMATLFGDFDLVSDAPGLHAPGDRVLIYASTRGGTAALEALPVHVWMQAQPGLWMATDGRTLALSPTDPLFLTRLRR